jgi:hypothetical protein
MSFLVGMHAHGHPLHTWNYKYIFHVWRGVVVWDIMFKV